MADFEIILGNKAHSSWSLRGWLAVKLAGVPFDEQVIPLYRPDSKERLLAHAPAGKVPILRHGEIVVWDSLAIAEYLAETVPEAGLWPEDRHARAHARAIVAEMHAGFAALRNHMPMDLRKRYPGRDWAPAVAEDIARIVQIWTDCRARFGTGGGFLFGRPSIADAAYAPVAGRFVTYGVELPAAAAAYRDAVMAWPPVQEWTAAAEREPWVIEFPEVP
jgi:glutathione S-transferase